VIYGQRMVALEALMPTFNMKATEWDNIGSWIREAGYEVHDPKGSD